MTTSVKKYQPQEVEKRSFGAADVEVRVENGKPSRIVGYAAKFGVRSEPIMGMFRETIAKGAFAKNLPGADVRFLVGHDTNMVLGRTKSGTLSIREDEIGLRFDLTLPNTTLANDVVEQVNRRDLDGMSFGFRKIKDSWGEDEQGFAIRTLDEVSIFEVSLTAFPAYQQTEVALRDLDIYRRAKAHPRRTALRLRLAELV